MCTQKQCEWPMTRSFASINAEATVMGSKKTDANLRADGNPVKLYVNELVFFFSRRGLPLNMLLKNHGSDLQKQLGFQSRRSPLGGLKRRLQASAQ